MNSQELLEQKAELKNEANTIIENCKREIRMMNEDETNRVNEIKRNIESINNQLNSLDVQLSTNINNKKENKMEKKNFSLVKAIRNVANNRQQDEFTQEVLNVGAENFRSTGNAFQGQIQLPNAEYRTITKATEGGDIVATDLFDIAQAISNKSVMAELGCNILSGLVNDVQFPVISEANATWEGETATTTATTPTFTSVKLSPKRLSVVVPISKMLLAQDSAGIERAVRNEITKAVMGKLEATIFGTAAGSATQPAGIFNGTISNTISDFASVLNLESALDGKDSFGEKKYLLSPTAKAALRAMIKGTNGTGMVMENGEVDGTPALCTGFVDAGKLAYGDFSNLVVGIWDGLDIVVDNYSLAADGCVRLVVNFYCDAKVVRDGAIQVAKLATT